MNANLNLTQSSAQFENSAKSAWLSATTLGVSRLVLLIIGQLLTWFLLRQLAVARPWATAAGLANFYLPLSADLGSFLLLLWLLRREKQSLRDLIGRQPGGLTREIALGVGLFIALTVLFQIASLIGGLIAFGPAVFDPAAAEITFDFVAPPRWIMWWSVLVLPITVGIVEELVYRGYLQPRFTRLTGRPWLGNVLTSFFFGLQHIVLPWATWQVSLSRFVATFLAGLFLGWVFHRQQRLLPLIIAHWALDVVFLGMLPLMALGVN